MGLRWVQRCRYVGGGFGDVGVGWGCGYGVEDAGLGMWVCGAGFGDVFTGM